MQLAIDSPTDVHPALPVQPSNLCVVLCPSLLTLTLTPHAPHPPHPPSCAGKPLSVAWLFGCVCERLVWEGEEAEEERGKGEGEGGGEGEREREGGRGKSFVVQ